MIFLQKVYKNKSEIKKYLKIMENEKKTELYQRNVFIDNLKGVCILFVIITHFSWTWTERLRMLFPYWIDMAIPIFMIISGYVYGVSLERKTGGRIQDLYTVNYIIPKLTRYTVPFILIFIAEICIEKIIYHRETDSWINIFLQGGIGPGSYYYPVMLQMIFVFPIIYLIIKKYTKSGLLLCFFGNFAYEILKTSYEMNEEYYRMLIFRYIFLIAYGCFLALEKGKVKKQGMMLLGITGTFYIYLSCYTDYTPLYLI